jgi:predicted dehydrogenase/threonine dehydrogenase-like Zn-dependent dehydrogenase
MSGLPLYRRALKQPEHVRHALEMMRDQGVKRTLDRVLGKLAAGSPTGYSAAGTVIATGEEVAGFSVGDRVACAGAGIANHAEIIDVPVNLAVRIPDGLGTEFASTVTLGAIAMQGVRRTQPTLGETVVVVGLGILGQLTVQLLRANGCRVIGVDLSSQRVRKALDNGMNFGIDPSTEEYVERVFKLTGGSGADAVIVTAATESDQVISEAMQACRKKGRVILVGDVGLHLKRSDFYAKELDFLISTSYGPGRYDPLFEEGGQDYPLPYVRWTETRNMEEYLRLLAEGRVSLANLASQPYDIDRATEAYDALNREGEKPLLVLLRYPARAEAQLRTINLAAPQPKSGKIQLALVGAGSFAQGMHLPNLVKLRQDYALRWVMSRTGSNARAIATQYEASRATTDYQEVLAAPDVDLVLISTRHHLHGSMVLQALRAGKHVFVEKPLSLSEQEIDEIEDFYQRGGSPVLMTGYNRRFSPSLQKCKEVLRERTTPLIVNYRMNAGYIPLDHWVHGTEGGGRNIGEACHIYDLFNFLCGARVTSAHARAAVPAGGQWAKNDNFVATIAYSDGSVCTLTYTALGNKQFPKEQMTVFADGKVLSMDDYKSFTITGGRHRGWSAGSPDKGHLRALMALADCLQRGTEWPIPLADQLQSARISFEVEKQIQAQGVLGQQS